MTAARILQNMFEIGDFIRLLRDDNVKSYLEIGSKFGGSLEIVGRSLPNGSRIVSVDLPGSAETLAQLKQCVAQLNDLNYDTHLIVGDSTDQKVVEQVYKFGPFDACLIDGNHTMPFLKKDWDNYRKICRIVAFHDIGFYREGGQPPNRMPIDVPLFWKAIKAHCPDCRTVEIRHEAQDNGIGVIWL